MQSLIRTGRLLSVLGMVLLATGCASEDGLDRREVRGTVTVDGVPVEDGNITLFPLAGGPVAAGKITGGTYVIEQANGPIPGEYRVEIIGSKQTGETKTIQVPGREPREIPVIITVVPMKYNEQSELTMTVGEEDEVVKKDFALEGE